MGQVSVASRHWCCGFCCVPVSCSAVVFQFLCDIRSVSFKACFQMLLPISLSIACDFCGFPSGQTLRYPWFAVAPSSPYPPWYYILIVSKMRMLCGKTCEVMIANIGPPATNVETLIYMTNCDGWSLQNHNNSNLSTFSKPFWKRLTLCSLILT